MAWIHYQLIYRLQSSLHVGYRKVGNLMQTRRYVPGKILWAALTARLTRDYDDGSAGERYKAIGRALHKHFRFGYLWPALPANPENSDYPPDVNIHFPWSDPHFDYRFLSSYAGTALNYDQRSSEEGSLRETEFIRPHARPVETKEALPVYLAGDLWVNACWENGSPLNNWKTALTCIQLGGERSYAWGRIRLICHSEKERSGSAPTLQIVNDNRITAHLKAENVRGITGSIEPVIGWERNNHRNRSIWTLSKQVVICYAPGSKILKNQEVTIGNYGILEMAPI